MRRRNTDRYRGRFAALGRGETTTATTTAASADNNRGLPESGRVMENRVGKQDNKTTAVYPAARANVGQDQAAR